MRLNFIQFVYGISSMGILVAFHLLMFKWVIPRIGDTNKVLEFSEGNTFRISKIRIVCLHLQLWITVGWLAGTVFLFESTKYSPKEVFLEWRYFFLLAVCFFAVIDLLIHFSFTKTYIFISKEEISFRLTSKKYCMPLNQIETVIDDERRYNIVTNTGKRVSISYDVLLFMECTEQLHKFFREGIITWRDMGRENGEKKVFPI